MHDSVIKGIVKSAELAQSLSEVKIVLKNSVGAEKCSVLSDSKGFWEIAAPESGDTLQFLKKGYVTKYYDTLEIPGIVRLLDDKLTGYQDKLWFYPGEEVAVYVHSSINYKATLYRHGLVKYTVLELENLSSHIQQVPDGYFVDSGLTWQQSFRYVIPDDAKPGLYSLLLMDESKGVFAVPMIVSTPISQKLNNRLLVMASTPTWQAYNVWGGRSRYLSFETSNEDIETRENRKTIFQPLYRMAVRTLKKLLPNRIILLIRYYFNTRPDKVEPWMMKKLSIRRPFTNCDLEGERWDEPFINHLAGGEWRILAWLESKGIEYDIVSGWELQYKPEVMENHKAILFSTHCEYWSCEMFNSVREFHEKQGLWIVNLAGNTMFREIQHYNDGSLRFVSGAFNKSCSDETKVIGVRFTDLDYGTCAPYLALDTNHWVFENSAIDNNNKIFGEQSLNQSIMSAGNRVNTGRPAQGGGLTGHGASGWEMDKLTFSSPRDFKIVAKGMNQKGGADMVVREPSENRGGIFSASSIVFGGSLAIDPVCSKIVENVLNKCLKS